MIARSLRSVALTTAFMLGYSSIAQAQESGLAVGTPAPAAMLETLDGKAVDLAQVAKGPAVIEFWATWCENCEHLLPAMQKAQTAYGSKVTFVAVAVNVNQSLQRVKLHVNKYKVPGVQLYDTKGNATDKWEVPATSYVVALNKAGKVVYTGVGGTQNIDAAVKLALK